MGESQLRSRLRPLLQHQRLLTDGQPDARPMVDRLGEDLARLVQTPAGIQHVFDIGPILGPLLDLVKNCGGPR